MWMTIMNPISRRGRFSPYHRYRHQSLSCRREFDIRSQLWTLAVFDQSDGVAVEWFFPPYEMWMMIMNPISPCGRFSPYRHQSLSCWREFDIRSQLWTLVVFDWSDGVAVEWFFPPYVMWLMIMNPISPCGCFSPYRHQSLSCRREFDIRSQLSTLVVFDRSDGVSVEWFFHRTFVAQLRWIPDRDFLAVIALYMPRDLPWVRGFEPSYCWRRMSKTKMHLPSLMELFCGDREVWC
jgi:hypothetical protein